MGIQQLMLGAGASTKTYVDEVFSTYVYDGTGSAQTVNNGIDLAGKGGLVWTKIRNHTWNHSLIDTVRGNTKQINSNRDNGEETYTNLITSFNNNGYTLGTDANAGTVNYSSSYDYASWTFRKAKGFFDVVTFTQASGTPTNQRISHSLGSAPGMILMKCTSSSRDWFCYHRSLGKDKYFKLNDTGAAATATNGWGTSEPDASEFGFNANEFGGSTGDTFVAYLFAHDIQSFGEGGNQSIIKCGSFNKSSGSDVDVDLGWEPQYVFTTMYEGPSGRGLIDNKRGLFHTQNCKFLKAHGTNAENNSTTKVISAKGFTQGGDTGNWLYMAIRIPDGYVGKPIEDGTKVFGMDTGTLNTSPCFDSTFPVDFAMIKSPTFSYDWLLGSRTLGPLYLKPNQNNPEAGDSNFLFDYEDGWHGSTGTLNAVYNSWMWKRYPKGLDVVAYKGVGGGQTVNHSLNTVPEMIWIKNRTYSSGEPWTVGHMGLNGASNAWQHYIKLNSSDADASNSSSWNNTAPSATQFTVGSDRRVDFSANNYIALLFASVEGVSKCGYYTGQTSNLTLDLGFQPRLFICKQIDAGGQWMIFDTLRGISNSGNDNILNINSNSGDFNSDRISLTSSGITLLANTDADVLPTNTSHRCIYYAHA